MTAIDKRLAAVLLPDNLARISAVALAEPAGPQPPRATSLPEISGTAEAGKTLSVTNGTWDNSPTSYAYQWRRNGTAISGATSSSYALVAADADAMITASVTATNSIGSRSATSDGVGPVVIPAVPANTSLPFIGGVVLVGETLTTTNGMWSGTVDSYAYQWKRNGVAIAGATASSYALVAADNGATITVTVTATNFSGSTSATAVGTPVSYAIIRRSIFGWNSTAGLDSARFASFCKITDTTGLIAYSPRHSSINDGELAMRLDVVSYTLDTLAKTLVLGTPVVVETPAGFTTGTGAAWAGQLLRLPTGRILLFYMFLNSPDGTYSHPDSRMDIKLRYSDDNGATWSADQILVTGETAYASFGVTDFNGAQAGLNIAGGTNHVVRLASGRIVLTGYLLNTPNHYLASIYTDAADGITGWTFGTPLLMNSDTDTEPSVAVTSGGTLLAFVRNEAINRRTIYSSPGGSVWTYVRAETNLPIRNVASSAFGEGAAILVGGATDPANNRKDYKLFESPDDGLTFPENVGYLFNGAEAIGYSFLGRVAPGMYGLAYEQSSSQTSFNQKGSLGLAIFHDSHLSAAPSSGALDADRYDATAESDAYIAYVEGDGGTIQDEAAVRAAIAAAISGNYYSKIAIAVSARWGHKNLGAANQFLYSLNRIKNTSSGTLDNVTLDTTSFAYATAGFPSVSAYLQFDGVVLRKGRALGCAIMDKAADTSTAAGLGIQWTDGAIHYFWPAGVAINGEEVMKHAPNYVTNNLIAAHFFLDCDGRHGVGGRDGVWEHGSGYFPGTIGLNETASLKIAAVGGANRRLAELWLFNGENLSDEMVRQCGEDMGARY